MSHNAELVLAAATCLFFFLLGIWTAPVEDSVVDHTSWRVHQEDITQQDVLSRRANAQQELLSHIQSLQNPHNCGAARRLLVKSSPPPVGSSISEQFAREFQYLALSLQVAVATGRMLVWDTDWEFRAKIVPAATDCEKWDIKLQDDLEDHSFHLRSISCLRQALISNCTNVIVEEPSFTQQQQHLVDSSLSFGILPNEVITSENAMFHANYYGPSHPVMDMPDWPFPSSTYLIDVVPQWERSFGRFWVRSQMAHYLWEQWHHHGHYKQSSSSSATTTNKPYIVFYWISCKKLRKNLAIKYGRNATITQDMGRYMSIAKKIREQHVNAKLSSLNTIYLLSDGVDEVPLPEASTLKKHYPDWNFVRLFPDEMTSDTKGEKRMLGALEVMGKADFLIGSFQSQLFRLAAELNAAWFAAHYPPSMQRHWALDVEWFENP